MIYTPEESHFRRKAFQPKMIIWYNQHGRMFPWRRGRTRWGRDPYRVLVSEVMLQQTQAERVIPYYSRWIRRWPTVVSLARARRASVIRAWAGLGYNRRAIYLHEAARMVTEDFDGKFPRNEEGLMRLPGVGRYTARAILAFAYGMDVGVLETNTKRVLLRVFRGVSSLEEYKHLSSENDLLLLADDVVPKGKGDEWNQAMMDFGAMVCTAKKPKCEECPLRKMCSWYANGRKQGMVKWSNGQIVRRGRFEETDRYFRGRIVDIVRRNSIRKDQLCKMMKKDFNLIDSERFKRLVGDLVSDGLISVSGESISLPT